MENLVRESGIQAIGKIPWSTHFCLFYRTKQDLADILVSYIEAGLKNNELCMCVTSDPLDEAGMRELMRETVSDFDERLEKGQFEIIPCDEWYVTDGFFDYRRVLDGWLKKLKQALDRGYDGIRVTGNVSWLEKPVWNDFLAYERKINDAIDGQNVIALCTYPLDKCSAEEIMDVVSAHQFALTKSDGKWKLIENLEAREKRKALRESEEKYRIVAENTYDWEFWLDPGDRVVYTSPSCERITGYKASELIENPALLYDITHPEDLPAFRAHRHSEQPASHGDLEFRILARNGETRWLHHLCQPVFDHNGRYIGTRGSNRDITERKRMEEALQFERSQLLSIFDSIDEVIYISDPDTYEILYANRAMQEKFGKDLIGGTCYREFQDKGVPCDFCTNPIILKNKGVPYRWEFHNPTVERDFLIVDRIIKWPDGRDVRFELAIDITERKRIEMDLKDAKARAELYLDVMGHDINNMHQIALGYLELARNMSEDASQQELLDKPMEVLQRSARVIQNVRKLQKLHDCAFQAWGVDACHMLAIVQREYGAIPGKAITLDLNGHEHCHVRANELLYDVFANLVSNAIKHTGDRTDIAINLEVTGDKDNRYCLVTVEDNGPGIPDDFKDRVFNRMLKGTDKSKGMGLGLFLVKSLVESYDGRVWVEDRVPGDHTKGAKFVVRLPVAG